MRYNVVIMIGLRETDNQISQARTQLDAGRRAERSVHTASHSQVRKPMYSGSIERWKHDEKHLEPLHRGLRWLESNSN